MDIHIGDKVTVKYEGGTITGKSESTAPDGPIMWVVTFPDHSEHHVPLSQIEKEEQFKQA